MSSESFVHLAPGSLAAERLREVLHLLGRQDEVRHGTDHYAVGPLHDVDSGAHRRAAWWVNVLGEEEGPCADDEIWEHARASSSTVVLWHGPHPSEYLFMLRACWLLRACAERVHEVALPPYRGACLPAFYGALAITQAEQVAAHWSARTQITDLSVRARAWERLRDQPGAWIRVIEQGEIRTLPESTHDEDLLRACADWTDSRLVVATVLADTPVGDPFLFWRLRLLLAAGRLEGRGEDRPNDVGVPAELRWRRS